MPPRAITALGEHREQRSIQPYCTSSVTSHQPAKLASILHLAATGFSGIADNVSLAGTREVAPPIRSHSHLLEAPAHASRRCTLPRAAQSARRSADSVPPRPGQRVRRRSAVGWRVPGVPTVPSFLTYERSPLRPLSPKAPAKAVPLLEADPEEQACVASVVWPLCWLWLLSPS